MNKYCKIISFGKQNKKFFILIAIGTLLYNTLYLLKSILDIFPKEIEHPIIFTICYSISKCLFFIFFPIYHLINKRKKTDNNSSMIENNILYKRRFQKVTKIEQFLWILLVTAIDFSDVISYSIFCLNIYYLYDLNTWIFDILSLTLSSLFILKIKLYRHHFFSIFIIIVLSVIDMTSDIISYNGTIKKTLMNFLNHILYNLIYVLYKHLMLVKFFKYYEILSYEGIIELLLGIISLIITTKSGNIDNFWDFIDNVDINKIIFLILFIVIQFIYYFIMILVIDIYSPFHTFILNLFSELVETVLMTIINNQEMELYSYIINIIFIFVCVFAILIYTEKIELYIFNLSKMTRRNIEQRAEQESITVSDDNNDDKEKKKVNYEGYSIELINKEDEIYNQDNE